MQNITAKLQLQLQLQQQHRRSSAATASATVTASLPHATGLHLGAVEQKVGPTRKKRVVACFRL